jgi:hypothetical protein
MEPMLETNFGSSKPQALYRNQSQYSQTLQTDTQFIHMETQTLDEEVIPF